MWRPVFKCPKGHSFDLAKFGYVNLAPQIKQSKDYDKENFQNRQLILEAGFYEPILTAIGQKIPTSDAKILDTGCGEGYYSRKLQEAYPEATFYAFDLSKESVQLAAKSDASWKVNLVCRRLGSFTHSIQEYRGHFGHLLPG